VNAGCLLVSLELQKHTLAAALWAAGGVTDGNLVRGIPVNLSSGRRSLFSKRLYDVQVHVWRTFLPPPHICLLSQAMLLLGPDSAPYADRTFEAAVDLLCHFNSIELIHTSSVPVLYYSLPVSAWLVLVYAMP